MTMTRFGLIVGLIIGAINAFEGFGDALIALLFAVIGFLVALTIEGRFDVSDPLGSLQSNLPPNLQQQVQR